MAIACYRQRAKLIMGVASAGIRGKGPAPAENETRRPARQHNRGGRRDK